MSWHGLQQQLRTAGAAAQVRLQGTTLTDLGWMPLLYQHHASPENAVVIMLGSPCTHRQGKKMQRWPNPNPNPPGQEVSNCTLRRNQNALGCRCHLLLETSGHVQHMAWPHGTKWGEVEVAQQVAVKQHSLSCIVSIVRGLQKVVHLPCMLLRCTAHLSPRQAFL